MLGRQFQTASPPLISGRSRPGGEVLADELGEELDLAFAFEAVHDAFGGVECLVVAAFAEQLERGVDGEGGAAVEERDEREGHPRRGRELVVGGALAAFHEVEGGEDAVVLDVVSDGMGLGEHSPTTRWPGSRKWKRRSLTRTQWAKRWCCSNRLLVAV